MRFKAHRRPGHAGLRAHVRSRRRGPTAIRPASVTQAAMRPQAPTPGASTFGTVGPGTVTPGAHLAGRWERNSAGRLVMVWAAVPLPVARPEWLAASERESRSRLVHH